MLSTGLHSIINHLVSEYSIVAKWGTINIRGIVIASAWNQNGEISAVAIAGYDEIRYRIADDHLGAQLRALIKKKNLLWPTENRGDAEEIISEFN